MFHRSIYILQGELMTRAVWDGKRIWLPGLELEALNPDEISAFAFLNDMVLND